MEKTTESGNNRFGPSKSEEEIRTEAEQYPLLIDSVVDEDWLIAEDKKVKKKREEMNKKRKKTENSEENSGRGRTRNWELYEDYALLHLLYKHSDLRGKWEKVLTSLKAMHIFLDRTSESIHERFKNLMNTTKELYVANVDVWLDTYCNKMPREAPATTKEKRTEQQLIQRKNSEERHYYFKVYSECQFYLKMLRKQQVPINSDQIGDPNTAEEYGDQLVQEGVNRKTARLEMKGKLLNTFNRENQRKEESNAIMTKLVNHLEQQLTVNTQTQQQFSQACSSMDMLAKGLLMYLAHQTGFSMPPSTPSMPSIPSIPTSFAPTTNLTETSNPTAIVSSVPVASSSLTPITVNRTSITTTPSATFVPFNVGIPAVNQTASSTMDPSRFGCTLTPTSTSSTQSIPFLQLPPINTTSYTQTTSKNPTQPPQGNQ